jgi:ABC-type multidrug transport system fused ATPase/permease subunit
MPRDAATLVANGGDAASTRTGPDGRASVRHAGRAASRGGNAPAPAAGMSWVRFIRSYLSYRKDLLVALFLCALVMTAAELSVPWLIKEAIDAVLGGAGTLNLDRWMLLTLSILAALYVGHVVLLRIAARLILHCSYNLRRRLYAHIHAQALPFFARHRTGALVHRVTSDTKILEDETGRLLHDIPGELVVVVGVTTLMVVLDPRLAMLVIAFMAVAAAVTGYLGVPLPGLRSSAQRIAARLTARLQETLAGVRTVQGFRNEAHELARLDAENRRILDVELRESRVSALMEPLGDLMELLGLVLVVWYGGHRIVTSEITAGTLVAFIAYMEILARPLGNAEIYYRAVQATRAVGGRLQELLDDHERLQAPGGERLAGEAWPIVVDGVSFRHVGCERDILHDVRFNVAPGEVVAVVGRNGAGKSTLLDLLLRFYDPTAGRIVVGGVELRECDLDFWRRAVGIMAQDVFLFHGTIAENIAYGRPEASREEIEGAVRDAGLDRLMERFPLGLETVVGERGAQLSGGERQAVALARLFLRKPKVLVMDEPTSQLDGEALKHIRTALRSLMAGRTTFLVTHNLETLQLASRVLFLEQGRLVADGTHETLYAGVASYKALWDEQSSVAAKQDGTVPRTALELEEGA